MSTATEHPERKVGWNDILNEYVQEVSQLNSQLIQLRCRLRLSEESERAAWAKVAEHEAAMQKGNAGWSKDES